MRPDGVRIEVEHEPRLCYAMQQAAVPWLRALRLHNAGAAPIADVRVTVTMSHALAEPWTLRVAAIAAGETLQLPVPDLRLSGEAFANTIERQRADLIVAVDRDGQRLATVKSPVDVLAYNEWPGLGAMPSLLASFVAPNHPALTPLLHDVAARLGGRTGNSALDGYQSGDAARARAIVEAVHDAISALRVTYVSAPPSFEEQGQKVRTPEQVAGERLGTCLDLALLYAALFEHAGLRPFVAVLHGHAIAGAWLVAGSTPEVAFGPAVELRKRIQLGAMVALECTLACGTEPRPFAAAVDAASKRLVADAGFVTAIDVAAARRTGIRPLPLRTHTFAPAPPSAAADLLQSALPPAEPAIAPMEPPPPPPAPPPADRLEAWKQKLLDLSMFNRLLNFVETKKTIRLCAHEPAALEDRLQQGGRVRVFARPALGQTSQDPRDLALVAERTGVDVMREYLADELRAGRLRAELDDEELAERQVEIFRHARTSLEETGANTLCLAIGFLRYFETSTSEKARRAPLLLLPLVVERLSVQDGFRFVLDDAEPRLNRTLLQYLQRDFELTVRLSEAPPEDERGVDVGAVLDAFRQAALAMPRWEVEPVACIGFFSFTKYLMWLDLANRDGLLASPVLQHLVERPGTALLQDAPDVAREQLDQIDAATVFCPKDADSSQLAAVLSAAGGRSFVLEGPPGTGKSQTIANLIAHSLANGKRVLFVAEKRAALEVVQRRLAEVGLGPFCLELHSSKSGPKAVLEQLRVALEVSHRREPAQWAATAKRLQETRQQLNNLVHDLHRPREHGVSVFAAMGELVGLRDAPRVPMPELMQRAPTEVAAAAAAVEALAAAGAVIGVPAQTPWWGVRRVDWTPALQRDVGPAVERFANAADALAAALQPFVAALALDRVFGSAGPSRAQLALAMQLLQLLKTPSLPPAALLRVSDWRALEAKLAAACALGKERDAAWAKLAPRWRRELLELDVQRLAVTYARAAEAFLPLRWLRLRGPKAELTPVAIGAVQAPRMVRDDLAIAVRVQQDEKQLLASSHAAAALGTAWRGGFADWRQVDAWLAWVRDVRALVLQLAPDALAPDPACLEAIARQLDGMHGGAVALPRLLGALELAHDELRHALAGLHTLLDLDDDAAFGPPEAPGHLVHVGERIERWRAALPALRDQCAYRAAAVAAMQRHTAPLVDAHARGSVAAAALVRAFRATFLQAWLDGVHTQEPRLARFRGVDHERAIARFTELDQQAIALAAEVVVARLAAQVPRLRDTQVASSELGTLEREIKKQRRHKPVRRLLAEVPGLLGRLSPCMLMSPLSVAQFLARGASRFDLVVFDEASQIPMWDAVGAIGRGSTLVVVGDSRQLPPTTFFQRLAQGDEIGNDELPEDLESVLDECSAAGLPRLHLDWHYRSRHESLITFSNVHYYRNRLLTFPAPQAVVPGLGVRSVMVRGVYDRAGSQTNRIEAEALVAEVTARLRDPERALQSIGIVTFSQAQQALIEDLLDAARAADPAIEAAFAAAAEPVFVKNLENVQGDERDVILFSIGYGPDAQGRVHENYGPLNMQGGERRLNVAVTRARRELIVFTSLSPDQVATRTPAIGARHLRVFLDYALRGAAALHAAAAPTGGGVESPFEAAVRDELERRGHEVHTQVGCSGYRIDLAVVDPRAPGRYVLGIECDGAHYHGAATARDRDRLRASVLRGLGWKLHRVWSTDFWQDPDGEIARIEAAIAAARAASPPPPPPSPPPPAPAPKLESAAPVAAPDPNGAPPPADPDGPRPYTPATLPATGTPEEFQQQVAAHTLAQHANAVLTAEAPIVFDRLARKLAAAWGLGRLTDRVRERVRAALPPGAFVHEDVVWTEAAHRESFRGFRVPPEGDADGALRPVEELPLPEIQRAMTWLLRQHQALAADDLAREAARCFGIQRLGTVVKEVMARAVELLTEADRVRREGDVVRLP